MHAPAVRGDAGTGQAVIPAARYMTDAAGSTVDLAGLAVTAALRMASGPSRETVARVLEGLRRDLAGTRREIGAWEPPPEGNQPVPVYRHRRWIPLTHVDAGAWLR